jgi:hypothetical protein
MKNKKSLLLALLCIIISGCIAQGRIDSTSLLFPKILVVKDNKEVLLVFDKGRQAFEVPGAPLVGRTGFKNYVDTFAAELGVSYSSLRTGGFFTYIVPGRYGVILRPYFVLAFSGYKNKGSLADTAAYRWFTVPDAIDSIPYPASAMIVKQVMEQPKAVWSATFEEYGYTSPVDKSKIKFKVIDAFYRLN